MRRYTLASAMALVLLFALGLAALKDASELSAKAAFTLAIATLTVGLVGVVARRGSPSWAGFSICGWIYLLLFFSPVLKDEIPPYLLTTPALDAIVERIHNVPPTPPLLSFRQATNASGDQNGKSVDGRWVPMSSEEQRMYKEYLERSRAHSTRINQLAFEFENSRRIGHSFLAMLAGLLGAWAALLLARWPLPSRGDRSERPPQST